jgi:hypothetical protein
MCSLVPLTENVKVCGSFPMHASKTEFSEYFIYKITWLYNVDKKLGLFFKVMQLLFLQYG